MKFRHDAEKEVREWIEQLIDDIEKIDSFFNSKFLELKNSLEMVRDTFMKKNRDHSKKGGKAVLSSNNDKYKLTTGEAED